MYIVLIATQVNIDNFIKLRIHVNALKIIGNVKIYMTKSALHVILDASDVQMNLLLDVLVVGGTFSSVI